MRKRCTLNVCPERLRTPSGPERGCDRRGLLAAPAAGLTLVELLVTLAVAAVLAAMAAPNMQSLLRGSVMRAASEVVVDDIKLARMEAIKRRRGIVMCRSADPQATTPLCGTTSNERDWTTGWLMFVDLDADGLYDDGVEPLLRRARRGGADLTIRTNSTCNRNLSFNEDGTTNEGGGICRIALCDGRGAASGVQIDIPPDGRPVVIRGTERTISCESPSA